MSDSEKAVSNRLSPLRQTDSKRSAATSSALARLPVRAAWALLAADAGGLILFFNLAFLVRLGYWPWFVPSMVLPLGILLLSLYVLDAYSLERQVSGMRPPARAVVGVATAGLLTGAAAYAGAFWGSDPTFGRGIFPVAFVVQALWSPAFRLYLGSWVRRRTRTARWLVIGSGEQALNLIRDFNNAKSRGEMVFLAENARMAGAHPELVSSGSSSDLDRVEAEAWSGVIVAVAEPPSEQLTHQLMRLRFSGVRVYDIADFYEELWFKVPVLHTSHGWLIFAHGFELLHNPFGLRLKRLLDVFFALGLLLIALPIMILTAILIKLESRGPVIFRQTRIGLNGRPFEILKFRSMVRDAERNGAVWAAHSDPRTTRVGRVIRTLRIDELPQLVNVLRGEMSFIGPRPERPEFTSMLEEEIPFYELRQVVRPGITGWAQVMYAYGSSIEDAREKLQYDLYYIKNYSVLLDVGILFKTFRVVLLGRGR